MTKSLSVPFPESETEHDGMPVFWRFQAAVEEDGIKIFALQYTAFHQTEHYAWIVPANWLVGIKPSPEQWLEEWKKKINRYAIKKVAKMQKDLLHSQLRNLPLKACCAGRNSI